MTHRESAIRRKRMAQEVAKGNSIAIVAQTFGVHELTVMGACKEYDTPFEKPPKHPASLSRNSQFIILAELLKTDLSIEQIVEELETKRHRVMQVLRAAISCGIPGLDHRKSSSQSVLALNCHTCDNSES